MSATHVLGFTNMREREMREPFEAMGARASLVTVDPEDGVGGYVSALRTGGRRIDERDTDAILVYDGSGLIGLVGVLLSLSRDVPLLVRNNGDVVRQHRELTVERARQREWLSLASYLPFVLLSQLTFRYAHGFVPVSESLVETIHRQTGCPNERIRPVPNSIRPVEHRTDGWNGGQSDRKHRLLTVTNLNYRGKYRGVVQLVEGLLPVLRRRDDLEYVVAGDGRHLDRFRRFLDERIEDDAVRNRIHVPGFVDDIERLYADADVFVYASYIDSYPNVVLEAQANALPIVTNPAYGITEQVEDGESGVFVDPTDGDDLARTVTGLLDDPKERARLGRNGLGRVEVENAATAVGNQLSDAIEAIVTSVEGPTPENDRKRTSDSQTTQDSQTTRNRQTTRDRRTMVERDDST